MKSPLQWIQSKKFNRSSPFLHKDREKEVTENFSTQRQQTSSKVQQELDLSYSDRPLDQNLDKYLNLANIKDTFHKNAGTEFADKVNKLKDSLSLYIRDYETMKEGLRWYIDKLDLINNGEEPPGNNKSKVINQSRTNESGEIVEMQENDTETEDKGKEEKNEGNQEGHPNEHLRDSLSPLRSLFLRRLHSNVTQEDINEVCPKLLLLLKDHSF